MVTLLSVLDQIVASPGSYYDPDIVDDLSDKTRDVFTTGTLLGYLERPNRRTATQ